MVQTSFDLIKRQGKKIVFTNGCFDVIHAGHIHLLQEAKKLGEILIVGLNSDESVRALKGDDRPMNGQEERKAVLLGIKGVDHVIIFEEESPANLIKMLHPDVYVKGGDYTKEQLHSTKYIEGYGGKVIIIPLKEGLSSTKTIKKMKVRRK